MEHYCLLDCFQVPDVGRAGNDISAKICKLSFAKVESPNEYF